MFTIYKYMFENKMCDEKWLLGCVPNAGLSQAEYDEIVGGKDETNKPAQK